MSQPPPIQVVHATAFAPAGVGGGGGGAIAILQLTGAGGAPLLQALTAVADWPLGRLRLARFDDIDEGLAVRLTEEVVQVMPHGGPRVVQRLLARLRELGAVIEHEDALPPRTLYPEAEDDLEALMLLALSRAASPLALNLLLDQPRRWRMFGDSVTHAFTEADRARWQRLNRLITPPVVALVGAPNVGKSTLTNELHGRAVSITADSPGTTRDYTAGRLNLGGLVVDWHDTPGVRTSDDAIEQRGIALAQRLLQRADLIIAMRDAEHDWPAAAHLPRPPDVLVVNKIDAAPLPPAPQDACVDAMPISAQRGDGLERLVATVRDRLVSPDDLANPRPWLFDERQLHPPRNGR